MGCINVSKSYFDINNSEERELRKWEKELGAYTIDFNQIHQKIAHKLTSISVKIIKRITEQHFSSAFAKLFDNEFFFYEGNKDEIDINKATILFFLLTSQGMITSSFSFYTDKSYYFYLQVKNREEEELSEALTKDSEMKKFIVSLIDVACVGFPRIYLKNTNQAEKGVVNEIANNKEAFAEFLMDDLFVIKGAPVEVLSFTDLKDKFGADNYFMNGGYIREKVPAFLASRPKN